MSTPEYIEVPCPSHDHPVLMIPKDYRRSFFDDLFKNDEIKWKLFTEIWVHPWDYKIEMSVVLSAFLVLVLLLVLAPKKPSELGRSRPA